MRSGPRRTSIGTVSVQDPAIEALRGLSGEEAEARLAASGPNELPSEPPVGALEVLVHQLTNSMVALLAGAAVISIAIGEALDAAVIAAVVVGDAALGYVQEKRADEAARSVRKLLAPTAVVIRDGVARVVDARRLVVGDVVALRPGRRVAADGRVITARALQIDESLLTGESLPVDKDTEGTVFTGTTVTNGEARVLVTATGSGTELARIAAGGAAPSPPTPLQTRLNRLTLDIVRGAVGVCVLLAALSAWRGEGLGESALIGISLAVAAVPEGLPAVVTVSLAIGVRQMAARHAIVRRLTAVETLGSTDVICTDKTGTLTENHLALTAIEPERSAQACLEAALHASHDAGEAELCDPLEQAIADAAQASGFDSEEVQALAILDAVPFDAVRKRAAVVVDVPRHGPTMYVKGAPEAVLPLLDASQPKARLERRAADLARSGARVLLVAERQGIAGPAADEERNLVAVGLLGFSDPPRSTARASVDAARGAGIRTIMVTGDHPWTALSVAQATGVVGPADSGRVVTGAEIDAASAAEFSRMAADAVVFARVVPEHKLRLVEALRTQGHVVAMTGDGVNDVPALRAADIGVAMGGRGSDAASEAADLVLADDDYTTIVAAVERGRTIYRNIRNFTQYLLAANAGEVLVFAAAITAGLGAPLTIVQILVVNLLTDGPPAVALAADPSEPRAMREPPRPRSQSLLAGLGYRLFMVGLATGAAAFAAFLIGRRADAQTGQTMAFTTLVASQLVYVFSARTTGHAWRGAANPVLLGAVILSGALAAAILAVPALRDAFDAVALNPTQLLEAIGLGLVPAFVAEVAKMTSWRGGGAPSGIYGMRRGGSADDGSPARS
jgi:P-type Ca2+ transporter type 2C